MAGPSVVHRRWPGSGGRRLGDLGPERLRRQHSRSDGGSVLKWYRHPRYGPASTEPKWLLRPVGDSGPDNFEAAWLGVCHGVLWLVGRRGFEPTHDGLKVSSAIRQPTLNLSTSPDRAREGRFKVPNIRGPGWQSIRAGLTVLGTSIGMRSVDAEGQKRQALMSDPIRIDRHAGRGRAHQAPAGLVGMVLNGYRLHDCACRR